MDARYRVNFVNSLSGYKSANLIGSVSASGVNNLAIFSSVVHLGADPALVGFINRPHSVERQTLENIQQTERYTINHVSSKIVEQAHHTSARYPSDVSEFDKSGLTPQWTNFGAPYVDECDIKYGVRLIDQITLPQNQTVLVIGQIEEVFCDAKLIENDGKINIHQAGTVAVSGLDEYSVGSMLSRFPYAKPR